MKLKRYIWQIFLACEIFVFSFFYYFGANGILVIKESETQNNILNQEIDQIKKTINNLQQEILQWDNDPFYKEKIAREQLQMAYPEEEIYIIKS